MEVYEKIQVNKRTVLTIAYDANPMNPRKEWDNVGTMVCWHNQYNLGDEKPSYDPESFFFELARMIDYGIDDPAYCDTEAQAEKARKRINRIVDTNYVILPLYLYDHSGITMNTTGFSCRWDSGQVGYIYVSKDKAMNEYGLKAWNKAAKEKVKKYLQGEVEDYDRYLTGDVYGFILEGGGQDDSCWGFYGSNFIENGLLDTAFASKRTRNRIARMIGGETAKSVK